MDAFDPIQRRLEHFIVKEEERAERLILGRSSDAFVDCQVREKRADFGLSHFIRMAFTVKEDELFDPAPVRLFGSEAIVFETNDGADLIDKFRRVHG